MKISCPTCSAKYTIADDKVRGKTVKIKCKKCGGSIVAGPDTGDAGGAAAGGASSEVNLAASGGSSEWLVNVGEGDQRSLTAEQIADLHEQGTISDETYIWRDGMGEWQAVTGVPEVAALLRPKAAPPPQEMDDALPTMMAPAAMMGGSGGGVFGGARPAAGPAPVAARRADAARGGRDLFNAPPPEEEHDDPPRAEAGGPTFSSPSFGSGAARRPPTPALIDNNDASGILDIRKLQGALDTKQADKKKEEKIDDIMNMGGGAMFSSNLNAPDAALAPPDFSAPPPPEPEPVRPVAAAPTPMAAPVPAEPPKSKLPMILGAVALLAASIGGTVMVMGKKNSDDTATAAAVAASADAQKKDADKKDADKKDADKKDADKAADPKAPAADPKADDKKVDAEHAAPAGKELTPEEKKRRDESLKKKKEEDEKKKKEEDEKKKKEEDEKKKKEAEAAAAAAPGGSNPFDKAAAGSALGAIASGAGSCKKADGPTGSGRIAVTFAPSGNVTTTNIEGPPFAGTGVGSCVAGKFRSAKVPPFAGSPTTVKKTFTIN